MSDFHFKVTVSGTPLDQMLRGWMEVMSPPGCRRVLSEIADTAIKITWENFGTAGAHRPSDWPALSPKYQKAIGYFGPPKLILEGDLISSIHMMELTDEEVTIGTDNPYAHVHQFGEGIVPPRPYFPFDGDPVGGATMTPYCEQQVNQAVNRTVREIAGIK